MKCVVTGAAGFIGSALSKKLLSRGHRVVGIDNFSPYYAKALKKTNLDRLKGLKGFSFMEKDILRAGLPELLKGAEYVFHLAAQAGVRSSWGEEFKIYTDNNIMASQKLLEAAKNCRSLKKLVYASSSSVYGDADELPVRETTPTNPMSPYGVSKLAAEKLCFLYEKNYGLPAVAVRLFTVYGPGQRPDMAFNIFVKKILRGEPLPVFSGGRQTRDFTYIDDITDGIILAAGKGTPGEVYNLGGGNRISLNGAIKIIERLAGRKAVVLRKGSAKGDVKHTWSDISKAKKQLGYSPKTKIEEGLNNEYAWMENTLA